MANLNNHITLTYNVAMWASRDAGSRNMRTHGRKQWNLDDWNVSVDEFNRLWPIERHLEAERFKANQRED